MAKTLRVRTRGGWVTKPYPDTEANALSAEEMDDNFLALEDIVGNPTAWAVGSTLLAVDSVLPTGWLKLDGTVYQDTTYPTLAAMIPDTATFSSTIGGISQLGTNNGARATAISPDSSLMAVAMDDPPYLTVYNTSTWAKITVNASLPVNVERINFSPAGDLLAYTSSDAPYLTLIETTGWTLASTQPATAPPARTWDVAFSPDGAFCAVAHLTAPNLTVYETTGWTIVAGTPSIGSTGRCVAFNSASTLLAVGAEGGNYLYVVDTSDWSLVAGIPSTPLQCFGAAFSNDDTMLAVAHNGGDHLSVFLTSDWSKIAGTPALPNDGTSLSWSPDDNYLVASCSFGFDTIMFIDAINWAEITSGFSSSDREVTDTAYSPDGSFVGVVRAGYTQQVYAVLPINPDLFVLPDYGSDAPAGMHWLIKAE